MKRLAVMTGLLLLVFLPNQALSAEVEPQAEEPVSEQILDAREILAQFYRGDLKEVYSRFSEGFKQQMSREQLTVVRRSISENFGLETEMLEEVLFVKGEYNVYKRRARFEKSDEVVEVHLSFREDHTIGAMYFAQEKK